MAEADVMLTAMKFTAEGIEVIEVVDTKYEKLGKTFAKGKKRAEGTKEALGKLNKQIEKNTKTTENSSVKNIESLMIMEAATSGLNQLISARYKDIDAQLASGEITQEEAEELRKSVKQQEKYSSTLERTIGILRLVKVAQFAAVAAMNLYTAATWKNTKAVATNTLVMLANPWVMATLALVGLGVALKGASKEFGFLSDQMEALGETFKPVTESIESMAEALDSIIGTDIANNKMFEALIE
jgi:polyhydroxyalkanoate synthesis regulator phasin